MVALTPEAVYAASPEFDLGAGSQPLDDGLGHYSYDGGASWEDQWGNKSYDQGASWSNQPAAPTMPGLDYGGTSGYFEPPPVADPWGPGLDYQEPGLPPAQPQTFYGEQPEPTWIQDYESPEYTGGIYYDWQGHIIDKTG